MKEDVLDADSVLGYMMVEKAVVRLWLVFGYEKGLLCVSSPTSQDSPVNMRYYTLHIPILKPLEYKLVNVISLRNK